VASYYPKVMLVELRALDAAVVTLGMVDQKAGLRRGVEDIMTLIATK
jgi:hypothetical protein